MMGGSLDSLKRIETPEGIDLELHLAGPVARALAWGIDQLIRIGVYLVLTTTLGALGKLGLGLALIAIFLLEWLYPVLFEVYFGGATPGKRALGLQVLHDDGTPVAMSASMVRNVLRFVDFLPFLYTAGLISVLVNHEFKRLGDLAAGTVVVYRHGAFVRAARPGPEASPPRVALGREDQRALLEFAERAPMLAPERADELAAIVAPVLDGADSPDRVSRLYAIANYLAGSV